MKLSDLIKKAVLPWMEDKISLGWSHFSDEDRQDLYELVIEKLYDNPLFAQMMLYDEILFAMLSNHYDSNSAREDILERLGDICDDVFDKTWEEEKAAYENAPLLGEEESRGTL